MTSVFEVLSNKEILQREAAKATIENMHQEVLDYTKRKEKLSTVRPTTQRYFMICQTCFWCASYTNIMGDMDALPYKACNHTAIELLPLSNGEHYRFEYTTLQSGVILEFR